MSRYEVNTFPLYTRVDLFEDRPGGYWQRTVIIPGSEYRPESESVSLVRRCAHGIWHQPDAVAERIVMGRFDNKPLANGERVHGVTVCQQHRAHVAQGLHPQWTASRTAYLAELRGYTGYDA